LIVRATLLVAVAVPDVPVIGKDVKPVTVTFNVPDADAAVVASPE
jgi:hypothetical protein